MEWIANPEIWIALLTLTVLEIVLDVDNVIFLPKEQQDCARQTGLLLAAGMRLLFLLAIGWIIGFKAELFRLFGMGFSGKDLIPIAGELFLIYKVTKEIHERLEGQGSGGPHLLRGDRTDPAFGPGVLGGLGDHRGRHDSLCGGDDGLSVGRGRHHALRLKGHLRLHQPPPGGEDAGPVVFTPDRGLAHRRGLGAEDPQGLHLYLPSPSRCSTSGSTSEPARGARPSPCIYTTPTRRGRRRSADRHPTATRRSLLAHLRAWLSAPPT
jgi:hypothetical protein